MPNTAVSMHGINKSFSGVPVLREVDFELRRGEVHALAGGNGAGKSTLMKILRGVHQPDSGEMSIDGAPVHFASTHDAIAAGISMIFQEFSVVPTLTVAQNTFLGRERRGAFGLLDDRASIERTEQLFRDMGVTVDARKRLENLGTAYWQLTEIAKALSQDARVLIMDEPTASLAKEEADHLFGLIRSLTARGISIVYISHRIEEIFQVADRVTVLRDGRHIVTADLDSLKPEQLIEHIVGRQMEHAFEWRPRTVARDGEPLLSVRGLRVRPRLHDVCFDLFRGEILGFAGLMGSGRSETARALFGIDQVQAGEIQIGGKPVSIRSSRDAIAADIALVPEDRRLQGLVLDHSVRTNLLLPLLGEFSHGGWIDDGKGKRLAGDLVERLGIKTAGLEHPVQQLSGGNQQKVVLAKWIGTEPAIYIMDEPTAGVDIGTKADIFAMIRRLADAGKAIIFISSEFAELLAVCDRVLVFRDGTVDRSLDRSAIPDEETLQFAVQGFERTTPDA
jgi:ribose transport system ATP-binding protein